MELCLQSLMAQWSRKTGLRLHDTKPFAWVICHVSALYLDTQTSSRPQRSCLIGGNSIGDCWLMESDDEFGFLLPGVGIECAGCLGHRSMTSPRGCGGVRHEVKYGCVQMPSLTGCDLQWSGNRLRWNE